MNRKTSFLSARKKKHDRESPLWHFQTRIVMGEDTKLHTMMKLEKKEDSPKNVVRVFSYLDSNLVHTVNKVFFSKPAMDGGMFWLVLCGKTNNGGCVLEFFFGLLCHE